MTTRRPEQPEGQLVQVLAIVDSGAYRTSFPLQIATDLGIAQDELFEDPHGGAGVGSRFRVWTTTVPIMAGIALFQPGPDGHPQPWGPSFSLSPGFIEHDAFLLGREDFFRAFTITFENTPGGQVFHLDT
jgi:hypothetical protein